jgi:SET domain-containing protein
MWKPLPPFLTIQKSKIDGLGLFSTDNILKDRYLGLSHIIVDKEIIRTAIGSFYNHSDNPNCIKVKLLNKYYLKTLKDINCNEEITCKYTFYKIN